MRVVLKSGVRKRINHMITSSPGLVLDMRYGVGGDGELCRCLQTEQENTQSS